MTTSWFFNFRCYSKLFTTEEENFSFFPHALPSPNQTHITVPGPHLPNGYISIIRISYYGYVYTKCDRSFLHNFFIFTRINNYLVFICLVFLYTLYIDPPQTFHQLSKTVVLKVWSMASWGSLRLFQGTTRSILFS